MASLSEIARAVQISRHRLSRLHNPCSLNFLAVLASSGRLKRRFSPSISTERRRPPFDSRPPGCVRRWRRNFAGSRGCRISLALPHRREHRSPAQPDPATRRLTMAWRQQLAAPASARVRRPWRPVGSGSRHSQSPALAGPPLDHCS